MKRFICGCVEDGENSELCWTHASPKQREEKILRGIESKKRPETEESIFDGFMDAHLDSYHSAFDPGHRRK